MPIMIHGGGGLQKEIQVVTESFRKKITQEGIINLTLSQNVKSVVGLVCAADPEATEEYADVRFLNADGYFERFRPDGSGDYMDHSESDMYYPISFSGNRVTFGDEDVGFWYSYFPRNGYVYCQISYIPDV